jgi:hypothetical protein
MEGNGEENEVNSWNTEDSNIDLTSLIRATKKRLKADATPKGMLLLALVRCNADAHVPSSLSEVPMHEIALKISTPQYLTTEQSIAIIVGHLAYSLTYDEVGERGGVLTPASTAGEHLLRRLRDSDFEFDIIKNCEIYEKQ